MLLFVLCKKNKMIDKKFQNLCKKFFQHVVVKKKTTNMVSLLKQYVK